MLNKSYLDNEFPSNFKKKLFCALHQPSELHHFSQIDIKLNETLRNRLFVRTISPSHLNYIIDRKLNQVIRKNKCAKLFLSHKCAKKSPIVIFKSDHTSKTNQVGFLVCGSKIIVSFKKSFFKIVIELSLFVRILSYKREILW